MPKESAKRLWVAGLPNGDQAKLALARLVDKDGGRDDAENEYYEFAADPPADRIEQAQRRLGAQFRRRQSRGRECDAVDG